MAPDCAVYRNGVPEEALNISIVKRPEFREPDALLFHMSNTTELALVAKSLLLSQNSTVTPVSKLAFRFDSLVPDP